MKIVVYLALVLCAYAADVKEKEKAAEPELNKEKRQTQGELVHTHLGYRTARKQEQVAPVEEPQDDDKGVSRSDNEQYRPGQVFSLNPQELLELQPERKAPLSSNQLLQQLYSNPQQEHKQNLQQIYYLEPQSARQVSYQPSSHAVIARPDYSSNGGEASVGAALSVSDSGSNPDPYNQDLLALLGQPPVRQVEEPRQQLYSQPQQHLQQVQQTSNVQSVAPQYQQVDRYITKPSKKSKLRNKAQIAPPQPSAAPQQYLIETTNVQQQQQQQQSPLYRQAPQPQPQAQRAPQSLRYVTFQQNPAVSQQVLYERPESQGLKVVPAPKLQQLQQQQPRAQLNYRLVPQYQQLEATPKQYRIIEAPRQAIRPQEHRLPSQSVERPIAYLKRFPDHEKMRSVKIYDPIPEGVPQQPAQIIGQQYYLRPLYRSNEQQEQQQQQQQQHQQQRLRYEHPAQIKSDQSRVLEPSKPPQSSIYVSKNVAAARKQATPQSQVAYREQQSSFEQVNLEQHGQNLDEQRALLPPPKNNKAYTPEEFAALVAAGYAVTPVPVSALNLQEAQSRSSVESVTMYPKRRPILASRRHQYLPLRGDDAP